MAGVAALVMACASDDSSTPDGADGPISQDATAPDSSEDDGSLDATLPPDAGSGDAADATISDATPDATVSDAMPLDATVSEASLQDAADATVDDVTDSAIVDVGTDNAAADTGFDSPVSDASGDSAVVDSGADGGSLSCQALTCPGNEKACQGACVMKNDPTYGCDPNGCGSRCTSPHASASCVGTQCMKGACRPGFADCNNDPSDGCEADLSQPTSCLACGTVCGGGQLCTPNGCAATCPGGTTQCTTRCLDLNTSAAACGGCNTPCQDAHGVGTCSGGVCTKTCDVGYNSCGGVCVDQQSDLSNCGFCGWKCSAPVNEGAFATCAAGVCDIGCKPGYTKCNGACVNALVDSNNCGGCGTTCSGGQVCLSGSCQTTASMQVLTGLWQPSDIAVDANNVYWSETGSNEVWKANKLTFAKTKLAAGQGAPIRIAINATDVFWANNTGNTIASTPIGGGAVVVIANATAPTSIAADASNVYWSDSGWIRRAAAMVDGGAPINLANLAPAASCDELAVDASYVYCTSFGNISARLIAAYDKTTGAVAWSILDFHPKWALWTSAAGACGLEQITTSHVVRGTCGQTPKVDLNHPDSNMIGDSCAVYGSAGTSSIWKYALDPLAFVPTALVTSAANAGRLAQDANYLYWVDFNWIGRVPK